MKRDSGAKSQIREEFLAYNAARNAEARRSASFNNELNYVSRLKALSPGVKLLDIGCGPGLFTAFWSQRGIQSSGIDIDLSLVKVARQRLATTGGGARVVVGSVEHLPYQSGVFDICFANAILEHVQDWQATLREVTRVLKDNGLLVFSTTNKLHPFQHEVNHFPFYPWIPEKLKKIIIAKIMKHRPDLVNYTQYPAIHWFTYEKLKAFLDPLGYQVFTRLDLVEKSDLRGWKASAKPGLPIIKNIQILRYLYYFYSLDVSVYAIMRPRHGHKVGHHGT
jgi:ubiquinone/menaquinone biosynthesis C-methylase UbiE